jgi:hypothetical protein
MRLPALEKNILVYRSLEMTLFLFYSEDVRRRIIDVGRHLIPKARAESLEGGKLLKAILDAVVAEGAISTAESEELQGLLEHRNTLAHEIHSLTADIDIPGRGYQFSGLSRVKYDYAALRKMQQWHGAVYERVPIRGEVTIFSDDLMFEAAERAYKVELAALRKRINRQMRVRKDQIDRRRLRSRDDLERT